MENSIQELAATCVENISLFSYKLDGDEDERVNNFELKVTEWLGQIEEKDIKYFIQLLTLFRYYDRIKIRQCFIKLFCTFAHKANNFNTIYMPITSKNGIINGATELINIFQRANHISKEVMPIQPNDYYANRNLNNVENIVFIDDIIGSGTTVKYFFEHLIKNYPKLIKKKKIFILSLVATQKGIDRICKFCDEKKIDVNFIFNYKLEKAFVPNNVFKDEKLANEAKKVIRKYEKRVATDPIYILGYKKSELLVSFYYNTPNNTLCTFWCTNKNANWNALLKRDENDKTYNINDKKSIFQSIKEKCNRKKLSIINIIKLSRK